MSNEQRVFVVAADYPRASNHAARNGYGSWVWLANGDRLDYFDPQPLRDIVVCHPSFDSQSPVAVALRARGFSV